MFGSRAASWPERRPSPSAVLATLALAIGVNTAVFVLVNAVLLKPLPYPHPEWLSLLWTPVRQNNPVDGDIGRRADVGARARWRHSRRPGGLSSWTTGVNLVVRGQNDSDQALFVQQQRVGTGFFAVLGVAPLIGREFTAMRLSGRSAGSGVERRTLAHGVGADRDVVGHPIALRGEPTPSSGSCLTASRTARAPTSGHPFARQQRARAGAELSGGGQAPRPRLTAAGTRRDRRPGEELQRERPAGSEGHVSLTLVGLQAGRSSDIDRRDSSGGPRSGSCCSSRANLAGADVTRAARRRREMATRLALGSGRAAIGTAVAR